MNTHIIFFIGNFNNVKKFVTFKGLNKLHNSFDKNFRKRKVLKNNKYDRELCFIFE